MTVLNAAGGKDMVVTDRHTDPSTGVTYTYQRQALGGIEVIGTESLVATDRTGRVVVSHDRRARGLGNATAGGNAAMAAEPRLSAEQAVVAAARALGLASSGGAVRTLSSRREPNRAAVLSGGGISLRDIPARLVYVLGERGGVRLAWDLAILETSGDHWWNVHIDATTGALLTQTDWVSSCAWGAPGEAPHSHEDHTDLVATTASAALAAATGQAVFGPLAGGPTAFGPPASGAVVPARRGINGQRQARAAFAALVGGSYRVVAPPSEAPSFDALTLVSNPADPTVSPLGWHNDGATAYTITRGNNVYAYEDADDNNLPGYSPDGGAGLAFDFAFDDATQSAMDYRDAAITNTFFWSNHLHDVLARLGFDEAAGNFQTTNTSGAGLGGDALLAEALDGDNVNNANFATPPDGQAPRMQMFQWTATFAQFTVNAPVAIAGNKVNGTALFGPQAYDVTGDLVRGIDDANASGPSTTDACTALVNDVAGKIVLVDRGTCAFTIKVKNAQNAGAIAVAIADHIVASISNMSGTDDTITIPAMRLLKTDGDAIKAQLGASETVNVRMARGPLPNRTSDMDAGVIAHEYGHGLSTRLTGGPANSSCLNATTTQEQGGEGWSDFLALMTTMRPGDTRARARGIGTYVFYQSTTGGGLRPVRYSPDFGINAYTYATTNNTALSQPHGIGFVWATMLWDLAWDLMDAHGIDPSMTSETAGNVIAMRLVIDGLKLQPCNPGFVDARDAILAADQLRYNGAHRTAIWKAFARRGLGASARQGLSSSRSDQVEAFDLPYDLLGSLKVVATAAADVQNGAFLTYTLTATNGTASPQAGVVVRAPVPDSSRYVAGSASNGGALETGAVVFPAVDLAPGESVVRTFQVQPRARAPREVLFADNAESGFGAWTRANTGGTDWDVATFAPGEYDGGTLFFAPDLGVSSDLTLTQTTPVLVKAGTLLRFTNYYDTEHGYDGGVVEVSANGGPWTSLATAFVKNGYNADIRPSSESPSTIAGVKAFSGLSPDILTSVADLSAYAGQNLQVRFRAASDVEVAGVGWAVDNIEIVKATALTLRPTVVGTTAPLFTGGAVYTEVGPAPVTSPVAAGLPATVTEATQPSTSSRTVTLQNTGSVPLTWFAEVALRETQPGVAKGGSASAQAAIPVWVSVSPQSGTVPANGSQQITLNYDTSTLPNGVYEADVTVYSNDASNSEVTIPVTYTVDSALPVELVAFTAVSDGQGGVLLRWTTASETDNAGFAIEAREAGAAAAGASWSEVAFVAGAGTTSEARAYERTLTGLAPGPKQFRLRQVDLDGTVAYSAAVEALVGMSEPYRLTDARPNPARTSARFDLTTRESQNVRVSVYDVQGREVAVLHDGPVEALQAVALTLDASALPSGVYLVRASGPQFTGVRRLTVVH